ncbi:MAG: dihydropteroate synthase [Candidatus Dormibacteria bacterium]
MSGQREMDAGAAEAALRHNVRPLTAGLPGSLGRALAALGADPAPAGSDGPGVVEAVAVEGLDPELVRALSEEVAAEGGRVVVGTGLTAAVLIGPPGGLAAAASRLDGQGRPARDLGGALASALASRRSRPPWRCGDRSLGSATSTLIMGVVNATPDSFSGDGLAGDVGAAVALGERLVAEGADLIDVGGESTRPGSAAVDAAAEMRRVLPVVEGLVARLAVPVSVDTRKAEVARAAVAAGATVINDIWGLRGDPEMAGVVAGHPGVALVAMHNHRGGAYSDLVADVARALRESLAIAARHGIASDRVVVDPGFGFGKTPAQNLELIQRLGELGGIDRPLLVGPSRKSTIGLLLGGAPPELRVEGTLALCVIAVAAGAEIVRVHDVAAVRRGLRVADAVLREIPAAVRAAPAPGPTG